MNSIGPRKFANQLYAVKVTVKRIIHPIDVSKSILNQCNTIFALRVFDDTGKNFLENYIGEDYSSTLPTLEERHAIAIGKRLKLKQPVIVQLNDRKYIESKTAKSIPDA